MRNVEWEILIAKFRSLGDVADNIHSSLLKNNQAFKKLRKVDILPVNTPKTNQLLH